MNPVSATRGYRMLAMALMLVIAFSAGSALVAFGDDEGLTIYGCLSPGGQLSAVTTDGQPECKGSNSPISWNQQGPPGLPGSAGSLNVARRFNAGMIDAGVTRTLISSCEDGEVLVGGGVTTPDDENAVVRSYPLTDTSWWASVRNETGSESSMIVYSLCASLQ